MNSSINNEKIILQVRRFRGFAIIFINDLKNLNRLENSYRGNISGIADWRPFGIGVLNYPLLGLKISQGVNIFLTNKRIYSKYILFRNTIFDIPLIDILSFSEIPLKSGAGIHITYKEKSEEKHVVLVINEEDASKWIKKLSELISH